MKPNSPLRRLAALLFGGLLALSPAAAQFAQADTVFMSEADEVRIGKENHPKILAQFGGEYDNPAVQAYVEELGMRLAKRSERPDLEWHFTVLDSPIVNAFALPGGYVYISRGLLSLADNEAQLASVVGHEIGHVTARHSAKRYDNSVFANLGVGILAIGTAILTGSSEAANLVGNIGGTLAAVTLQSYSREDEFEADKLGIRYMARAGYDVTASPAFLGKLREHSLLEAKMIGAEDRVDQYNIMATHPRTIDRVKEAGGIVDGASSVGTILNRDRHLDHLDGIIYGDSPAQGYVMGTAFAHPELRFRFEVPQGFRMHNSPANVSARNPAGSVIVFDGAPNKGYDTEGEMRGYIRQVWAPKANLRQLKGFEINGMAAAWALAPVQGGEALLAAISFDERHVFRFVYQTKGRFSAAQRDEFRDTVYSFRRISASEAAALKPQILDIAVAGRNDTVSGLAAGYPDAEYREERFRVLNGLPGDLPVEPGMRVKLITQ